MGDRFAAARADMELATRCQEAFNKASIDYQAACITGDWCKVEAVRTEVVGSLEAFLDNYAAAFKVMIDV
jgi:uncharacterized HAD superfamily protein